MSRRSDGRRSGRPTGSRDLFKNVDLTQGGFTMRYLKYLALVGVLMVPLTYSQAQVSVGVGFGPGYIGVAPVCEYGYYSYYPYDCAPYGYYGPDWFVGGLFIGAGPWFHGHRGFFGHVDNRYDPHYGYHGP